MSKKALKLYFIDDHRLRFNCFIKIMEKFEEEFKNKQSLSQQIEIPWADFEKFSNILLNRPKDVLRVLKDRDSVFFLDIMFTGYGYTKASEYMEAARNLEQLFIEQEPARKDAYDEIKKKLSQEIKDSDGPALLSIVFMSICFLLGRKCMVVTTRGNYRNRHAARDLFKTLGFNYPETLEFPQLNPKDLKTQVKKDWVYLIKGFLFHHWLYEAVSSSADWFKSAATSHNLGSNELVHSSESYESDTELAEEHYRIITDKFPGLPKELWFKNGCTRPNNIYFIHDALKSFIGIKARKEILKNFINEKARKKRGAEVSLKTILILLIMSIVKTKEYSERVNKLTYFKGIDLKKTSFPNSKASPILNLKGYDMWEIIQTLMDMADFFDALLECEKRNKDIYLSEVRPGEGCLYVNPYCYFIELSLRWSIEDLYNFQNMYNDFVEEDPEEYLWYNAKNGIRSLHRMLGDENEDIGCILDHRKVCDNDVIYIRIGYLRDE